MRCCQLMQATVRHCIDEDKHIVGFPGTQHVNQLSLVLFPACQQGQAGPSLQICCLDCNYWQSLQLLTRIAKCNVCPAMCAPALMHLAR